MSVMLEALFTGVFASAIGVVAGIAYGAGAARRCSRRSASSCRGGGPVVQPAQPRHLDGHRRRRHRGRGVPAGPQGGEGRADRGAARRGDRPLGDVEARVRDRHVARRGRRCGVHRVGPVGRRSRARSASVRWRVFVGARRARSGHRPARSPGSSVSPLPRAAGYGGHAGPGERDPATRGARRRRPRR